eukprot:scaffold16121_cov112-Isochrysis_galbana.AAC.3
MGGRARAGREWHSQLLSVRGSYTTMPTDLHCAAMLLQMPSRLMLRAICASVCLICDRRGRTMAGV